MYASTNRKGKKIKIKTLVEKTVRTIANKYVTRFNKKLPPQPDEIFRASKV